MAGKTLQLVLCIALIWSTGQLGGCAADQNYRLLEEDNPPFEPHNPIPDQPGAADAQLEPTDELAQADVPEADPVAALHETEPSVTTLDRSHWPVVTLYPVDGRVRHTPYYFEDLVWYETSGGVAQAEPGEARLIASLEAERSPLFGSDNRLDTLVQPFKFAYDLISLPVFMAITPPWTTQTTP